MLKSFFAAIVAAYMAFTGTFSDSQNAKLEYQAKPEMPVMVFATTSTPASPATTSAHAISATISKEKSQETVEKKPSQVYQKTPPLVKTESESVTGGGQQTTAQTQGLNCHGKIWSACASHQDFYCPSSGGDPTCVEKGSIMCNDKSWGKCANGTSPICPSGGGDAYCMTPSPNTNISDTSTKSAVNQSDSGLIGLIEKEVQSRVEQGRALSEKIMAVNAKYRPQIDSLQNQITSILAQQKALDQSCGGFCTLGESASKSMQLTNELLVLSTKMSELTSAEKLELSSIPGYSSSFVNSATQQVTIPLFPPNTSIRINTSDGGSSLFQVTQDFSGGYYLRDALGGGVYRVSQSGTGSYYVAKY